MTTPTANLVWVEIGQTTIDALAGSALRLGGKGLEAVTIPLEKGGWPEGRHLVPLQAELFDRVRAIQKRQCLSTPEDAILYLVEHA